MSMNLKEQLEVDIQRFFENIDKQSDNDKVETLRNLMDKYIHLSKSDFLMNHFDLMAILSSAKGKFANETFPVILGSKKQKVLDIELPNLCVIEATIEFLNKNDCLKKMPKFDKQRE
jgi:hypothetical protein